jgi:hypothetical protein
MKPNAADRLHPRRAGWLLVALGAAAVLVLGGCGQFNDDPNTYDMAVRYSFDPGASGTEGTSGRMATWNPGLGTPVVSLVIGAVYITFSDTPITDVVQIDTSNQDALINDAIASLSYLELVQLAELPDPPIASFKIPPDVGNWQLVAAGLRVPTTAIEDVDVDDVIWFGFTDTFLNGQVQPGELYSSDLVLNPWCAAPNPSSICPP